MSITEKEQQLLDFVNATLPHWFTDAERPKEYINACAKIFGDVLEVNEFWHDQTYILKAVGASAGEPDWLNQHAIDYGTHRQENETTEALRDRLRNVPDAVTAPSLLAATLAILEAEGISGTAVILNLRRDRAFLGTFTSDQGTGGKIIGPVIGSIARFQASGRSYLPVPDYDRLYLSGASNPSNNGTFLIVGFDGDYIEYWNASAVTETFPGTWKLIKYNPTEATALWDTFTRAHLSRGYRLGLSRSCFVIILPYGSTAGTAAAVAEMLRQKKGAGVVAIVERRTSP